MTTITRATSVEVHPLEHTIGGKVVGLDPKTVESLRAELLEQKVLGFPRASMSPDEQERFARYFVELLADPEYPNGFITQSPNVVALGPSEPGHSASSWHQGGTWKERTSPLREVQNDGILAKDAP